MMKMPRETYTFSYSTRGNDPGNNEDFTMEFEAQEVYLDELLEKFQRFLSACGYCLNGMEIQAVRIDEDDHSHCNHDDEYDPDATPSTLPEPPRWALDTSNNSYNLGEVTFGFDGLHKKEPK